MGWLANFRLPPGIGDGWNAVRLRLADSGFGDTTMRIAVNQPVRAERLGLKGASDGMTWNDREGNASNGGFISCWGDGLPEKCDRAKNRVDPETTQPTGVF